MRAPALSPTGWRAGRELVELAPSDPAWLRLVGEAPGATVFHQPAWTRVVSGAYGFRAAVLAVPGDAGRLAAGLPVVRVRRPGGRAWVSLPYSDHCPPLAADDEGLLRLAAQLPRWSAAAGLPLEVRAGLPEAAGWAAGTVGVRHLLPLDGDLDGLRRRINRGHRERLGQAERGPLRVRLSASPDDLAAFYRLQVRTRRRQGVPVQPLRFFRAVWEEVLRPGLGVVALVETAAGTAAGGAVVFAWNGTAIGKYLASDPAHLRLRPNHLLYWAAIGWATGRGCRVFDLGRSEDGHTGLQEFKTGWGGLPRPLDYTVAGGPPPVPSGPGPARAALAPLIRRSPPLVCRLTGTLLYRFAG